MELNYIKGSREEFFNFVDSIGLYGKVGIVSHIDLDGLASAVFLEEILKEKGIKIDYIDFTDIRKDMVKEISVKLKEKGITKVFFCDLGIDSIDFEGFKELREEMDVFLIDHHPMNEEVKNWNNIIKTDSQDCSAMTCFFLGEGIIDSEKWTWLNCAAIFSDFSYKEKKNLEYLQSVYPDVNYENISSTTPGINSRIIASGLVYYQGNEKYVYDLVKERNLEKLKEVHQIIEDEVDRLVNEFGEKSKFYQERKLYFYEIDTKFNLVSAITTLVSKMKPEYTFVFMQRWKGILKFSARNQSGSVDVGALMKKCVDGLSDASGGGHKMAGSSKIQEKDKEIFMKRLLE
ncbi:DHH family phosphoesterase [archaeon]|nr:DHH family phosphoesterase [archaeon]